MVIKMYMSGISASKEVKKRQLRAQFLLDSYKIKFETVDITDPLQETARHKMLNEAKKRNEGPPMPPQFYNEDEYCGDYEDLENANDNDELMKFLKLEEDIAIENGGDNEGEYDLFKPPGEVSEEEANKAKATNGTEKENKDDEDEDAETEVREQITVNGVIYTIPADRKINVGGRIIDVDELLADEGEEIDLDEVDERLKKDLVSKPEADQTEAQNEDDESFNNNNNSDVEE